MQGWVRIEGVGAAVKPFTAPLRPWIQLEGGWCGLRLIPRGDHRLIESGQDGGAWIDLPASGIRQSVRQFQEAGRSVGQADRLAEL